MEVPVDVADQLAGPLGRGVEGDLRVDAGIGRGRRLGDAAIDRAGAGVDDVFQRGQFAAELQEHHLAHHVGLHVGVRVHQGMAHSGLGREMDDPGDRLALRRHRRGHRLAVGDIGAHEVKVPVGFQQGEPGLFEAHVVVGVHVIHAEDALAAREQRPADVEADEAGGPGHEDRHRAGYPRKRRSIAAGSSAKSSITASAPRSYGGIGLYP